MDCSGSNAEAQLGLGYLGYATSPTKVVKLKLA